MEHICILLFKHYIVHQLIDEFVDSTWNMIYKLGTIFEV